MKIVQANSLHDYLLDVFLFLLTLCVRRIIQIKHFQKMKICNFEAKYLGTEKSKTCQVCARLKALFMMPEF